MKVLFDQGTPVPLCKHLARHEVATAFQLGWATLENGELLQRAESEGFDVQVLEYVRALVSQEVRGGRGSELTRFAGTISMEDLELIEQASGEG